MRIGIFGGSFDPVHLGHLIIAERCRDQARLDQVWFIPSATAPHKLDGPSASGKHRFEMLHLAIAGNDAFAVSDVELARGQISYTVDTLQELQAAHQGHEWFLILGSDSLAQFGSWREPQAICQMAMPLVYGRPGHAVAWESLSGFVDSERLEAMRQHAVVGPLIDISSTLLRQLIPAGRSVRYLIPRAVQAFIQSHGLYARAEGTGVLA